jgi:hypothetical protein
LATWSKPIYDRTLADVEYARQQLEKQINNANYKGCLNANDLTRIENNTRYLADELIKLYYFNSITTRTWSTSNAPNTTNIATILNNISKILSAYQKPKNIPTLPTTLLTYEQVNAVEKNLFMIKEMLDNMIASFRQCGTFGCGEG